METDTALCSKPDNWFPVNLEDPCHYLPEKRRYTCSDCACYGNNMGCIGMRPDEEPYWGDDDHLCDSFEDRRTEDLYEILSFWYAQDTYDRDKIIGMLDDFEKQIKDITEG